MTTLNPTSTRPAATAAFLYVSEGNLRASITYGSLGSKPSTSDPILLSATDVDEESFAAAVNRTAKILVGIESFTCSSSMDFPAEYDLDADLLARFMEVAFIADEDSEDSDA